MKIVQSFPPNFASIHRVFPNASGPGVLFAYAPDIYSMYVTEIPPEMLAHEKVHIERQEAYEGGVEAWWARYLVDAEWRYNEELLAHRAEYQYLSGLSRQLRRSALKTVAKKLSGALYGRMIPLDKAIKDLAA